MEHPFYGKYTYEQLENICDQLEIALTDRNQMVRELDVKATGALQKIHHQASEIVETSAAYRREIIELRQIIARLEEELYKARARPKKKTPELSEALRMIEKQRLDIQVLQAKVNSLRNPPMGSGYHQTDPKNEFVDSLPYTDLRADYPLPDEELVCPYGRSVLGRHAHAMVASK